MAKQKGFYVNVERCIGCHTCEIACKETNDLEVGVRWRRVRTVEGGAFPKPYAYFVSMGCNHCADPICLKVCPVGAYSKRESDGLVIHDQSKCIGCKYCLMACPYAAPQYDEAKGKMGKCSGCASLVDAGKEPACVSACIVRALEFGDLEDLKAPHKKAADTLPVLPDRNQTKPSVVFKTRPEVTLRAERIVDGHRARKV